MNSAEVTTMSATVRVLQVGNRQVTMSMAKQLDCVRWEDIKPFGRIAVSDGDDLRPCVRVIGRRIADGELVTARVPGPLRFPDIPSPFPLEGHPNYVEAKSLPLIILGGLR